MTTAAANADDRAMLDAYRNTGDREALAELVRRHLSHVYTAALRQTRGDPHLAEDVTQAVFILFAQKAARLRNDVILRDWLFITTRYAAKNAMKTQARRRY